MSFTGDRSGRFLGQCVASGGHVDGSGPADLIISANEDPEQIGYNRGRVYVIANSFSTTAVPAMPAAGLAFVSAEPNPARSDVSLVLALDHAVPVRVSVYDLAGHEVARPVANEWLTGRVTRIWRPQGLPSGLYWVRARLGDREVVRKVAWLGSRP